LIQSLLSLAYDDNQDSIHSSEEESEDEELIKKMVRKGTKFPSENVLPYCLNEIFIEQTMICLDLKSLLQMQKNVDITLFNLQIAKVTDHG
jgi:hypothetical protein